MDNEKLIELLKGVRNICNQSKYTEEEINKDSKRILIETFNKCLELISEKDASINLFFKKLALDASLEEVSTFSILLLCYIRPVDSNKTEFSIYEKHSASEK